MNPKEFAQMFPEGRLQEWQVEEILRLSDAHEASASVESGTGNQAVDVGMKSQLLVPGVEHRGKATGGGPQPFGGRQLLALHRMAARLSGLAIRASAAGRHR